MIANKDLPSLASQNSPSPLARILAIASLSWFQLIQIK
jgi:hypothetical protein